MPTQMVYVSDFSSLQDAINHARSHSKPTVRSLQCARIAGFWLAD